MRKLAIESDAAPQLHSYTQQEASFSISKIDAQEVLSYPALASFTKREKTR